MPHQPRVIFASENLQLGGLLAIALARLHRRGDIDFVALWSRDPVRRLPPAAAAAHAALIAAETVQSGGEDGGAIFGGVHIASYSQLASELGIEYRHVPDMAARHIPATVNALAIDLGVCCGHSQYFRRPLRNAARLGWVNCHPSLLPLHRGPYPAFWELRNGEHESGITVHQLSAKFDAGPMLAQFRIPLEYGMTFAELVRRQGEACGRHVPAALLAFLRGESAPVAQPAGGSRESAPIGEDFVLDASMSCDAVGRFILGMKGVGPVLVRMDGALLIAENAAGWQTYPAHPDGRLENPIPPTKPRWIGPDRIEFPASDGLITLLVRGATPTDLGQQPSG